MSNHLNIEKSPYLLQHADNPVDWFPWGKEAFDKAGAENKPIFLSIGYATCHWCHVMAHESFEDREVADLLNRFFVSIKVDREERPDVDSVYMAVCQAFQGSGGWPLSVFLTPEGKPFFAGTYFPKESRRGMTGFKDLLVQLHRAWREQGERIARIGEEIVQAIRPKAPAGDAPELGVNALRTGFEQLRSAFDPKWGGFGRAPKFPTPHHLTFALRWRQRYPNSEALAIVEKTLDAMRNGGIFDHLGLGFHRYSVDERWFAPHFEKMLYDQALLALAYLEAWQVTAKPRYATVAEEIFQYVLRDMQHPEGGFYSAEDADSEGVEGLFYLWKPSQVKEILGDRLGDLFCRFYDVTEAGNFEHGLSILHISKPLETFAKMMNMEQEDVATKLADARRRLFEAREQRVHPLKDDKILTAWNGLMIAALAKGYQALKRPEYARAARRAADFVLDRLQTGDGRLMRRYRDGETAHAGCLEDYAFFVWGLIELYEATFEVRFLERATQLHRTMIDLFLDRDHGGFFFTASDAESLIVRDKDSHDGAVPSGNSVAALNSLRLARMTGNVEWDELAERSFKTFAETVSRYPMAFTQFLNALDFAQGPVQEVVIAGDPQQDATRAMVNVLHEAFQPNRVVLLLNGEAQRLEEIAPFLRNMRKGSRVEPEAYICRANACQRPVTGVEELRSAVGLD